MQKRRFSSVVGLSILGVALTGVSSQATLIVNGDFEAGNTGFSSSYTYVTPGGSNLSPEGTYTVDNNPRDSHGSFYSMGDHTTGVGQMLIVNGATTTGVTVWEGTISVDLTVGQEYDFSAWMASVYPVSPAILTFSVDGVSLGTLSPSSDGSWGRLYTTFTAGQARPTFSLINSNSRHDGNDFAIDDIDVYFTGTTTPAVPDGGAGFAAWIAVAGLLVGACKGAAR